MENESEKYIQLELAKFDEILGILNNTFKPTWSRNFQEAYNALTDPIFVYGREICDLRILYIYIYIYIYIYTHTHTHTHTYRKRLTSVELKYFRRTAGTLFWTTKAIKKFWKVESRTS